MPNKLQHETSPYLLQHADNPVNWFPWGEEALNKARDEDKPILLSVGYSACHWCHVMAHESFEDKTSAAVMNELFVNIKVDREERPDLDKIYQRAHQLLTQRPGGWPLTVFLMSDDHVPFFAGTYFPKEARYQLPAFTDMLRRISDFYQQHRDKLEEQNISLMQAMKSLQGKTDPDTKATLTPAPLDMARRQLEQSMDWKKGGFGKAPKFPHPTNIERLLRHWAACPEDQRAQDMALINLRKMAEGGMNDQLGGGFCRYSVDDDWMIPHFEKMLYDNGPLLCLYSEAWAATHEPLFAEVMQTTTTWVMREMQSEEGGYYSSLDADSEGEEGKFYAWNIDEIKEHLDENAFTLFSLRYGLDRSPNFEGKYYPHTFMSWEAIANKTKQSVDDIQSVVTRARLQLFEVRKSRIHPGRDDKILTSWNALMIKGMASAVRHSDQEQPGWLDSAFRALDFIKSTLWKNNRLLATYKDGKAHLNAYLDDYVFLIDAILELSQAQWREGDLDFASQLADVVLEQFEDTDVGGFFFTSHDHEQLIERPKPFGDEATPSGNGIAAFVLNRLGHLLGNDTYLQAAERTLKAAWNDIQQIPYAHNSLLLALEEIINPPEIIILRGKGGELKQWQQLCVRPYAPRRMTLALNENPGSLPEMLNKPLPTAGDVNAWVCNGTQCHPEITSIKELTEQIKNKS